MSENMKIVDDNDVELTMTKKGKVGEVKIEETNDQNSSNNAINTMISNRQIERDISFSSRLLFFQLLGCRGLTGIIIVLIIAGLMIYAYMAFVRHPWYILVIAIGALFIPLLYLYQIYKQIKMIKAQTQHQPMKKQKNANISESIDVTDSDKNELSQNHGGEKKDREAYR